MAAREQTGDSELYRLVLAYNDFTNLRRERLNVIGHAGMICGNNAFRKHGVWGNQFRACYFYRGSYSAGESDKSSFSADFRIRRFGLRGFNARAWSGSSRKEAAFPVLRE